MMLRGAWSFSRIGFVSQKEKMKNNCYFKIFKLETVH